MISNAKQWTVGLWRWLAEAKLGLIGIFVIFTAVMLGFVIYRSEESIRIAGCMLQLSGMIFAIKGLLGVRKHFGQPLLRQLLFKWLGRFPKWKRNNVIKELEGNACISLRSNLSGELWTSDDPEIPIEQRIERIIKNIKRIQLRQIDHEKSIDELRNSLKALEKHLVEKNKKIKEDIQIDLELLHTGDWTTSLMGLVWVTVGITMSTLAPELSKLIY